MQTNLRVVDTLPPDAQFVSASSGCTYASGVVTCVAPSLAAGVNATFTITVQWTNSGPTYDTAGVTTDQVNAAPANQQTLAFGVAPANSVSSSDGPMPLWSYALLAILLFMVAAHRQGQGRGRGPALRQALHPAVHVIQR